MILKSQQNIIELVTRPGAQEEMGIPYVRLGVAPKDIANNFGAKKTLLVYHGSARNNSKKQNSRVGYLDIEPKRHKDFRDNQIWFTYLANFFKDRIALFML